MELVQNQTSLGFFNRLFLVPKPNNKWRPILDQTESFPQGREIQNGDTGNHQDVPPTCSIYQYRNSPGNICPGSDIPIQRSAFRSVHSTLGVYCCSKGGETDGHTQGYKNPPVPRRLVGESQIPPGLTPAHPNLVKICQELGWLVNLEKSELEPKQIFDFVGYQFDLRAGRVRPTPDRWQNLQDKILEILSLPACPVRQFMSLIGLLTATEKQVHLGRLHMRPIQWHLKNNWRVPESLEKVIPIPRSLHPHLQWWLKEDNVLTGQPLHPIKHALQIFTDASKEGWGAHLSKHTARGSWSLPESKLHINFLQLKAVFLALKEFQALCTGNIILVATDNTTVVSYINKEGGMRSGPLCALLWRILSWCTGKQVTLKAQHIPGRLNVVSDKLSRLGQTIQTEWSLLPEVFKTICSRWHQPQIDLFATRFNNKLSLFVSPVPDPLATAVDALSLPWEDLDAYAFPPSAILGKVVEKLQDSPCKRIILIAPGWPNMPWFWDLVTSTATIVRWFGIFGHFRWNRYPRTAWWQMKVREFRLRLCLNQNIYKICETYTKAAFKASNDHCTGKLNYVKLIRESIWFALIDSRIDSVCNILIRCTPTSDHVQSDPTEPAFLAQPVNTALQSDPSQKSDKPKSPCMAPRATAMKEQASLRQWQQELRLLKEDQPDQSMRQIGPFLQSGVSLIRWTSGHPPVKSVADFLMYLFQDRKLQPSTIDGYRSAIADKLGNSSFNISKDKNLIRLLDSFHRDRPKGRRGIPSWNLSLDLHQLTKASFEPIKEASLKHLTFKTVFLMALGSGKRRSEIHALPNRNIRHQSDLSKVSLYP